MNLMSTFSLTSAVLLALLSFPCTFIQSSAPATPLQTFNVHGAVRIEPDYGISGAKVIFKGEGTSKTVLTDTKGFYQADLPVGFYTMFVVPPSEGFKTYQRPLFRVTASTNITWDVSIWPAPSCDPVVPEGSDHGVDVEEATDSCGGWKLFSAPSQDGVPFQLLINYPSRPLTESGTVYTSRSVQDFKTPVFVAYNLFTLQADRVTYDEKTRTLEASGNVVAFNEKGEIASTNMVQTAESMTFRIANGEATRLQ
ncbi:MAG TPA: hypothetical protein VEU52_00670 [Candidatus Limnocylindrales bacterium]|nr:hypothetical protein [Candidatus Limnocylindrales bacterium]